VRSPEYIARQKARQKTPEHRAYQRRYYEQNKERILKKTRAYAQANKVHLAEVKRLTTLKNLYDTTPEEVEQMRESQAGICAICFRERPLVIDHCHTTGRVRGLLCRVCNSSLGGFQDSTTVLESAKLYLIKYGQPN